MVYSWENSLGATDEETVYSAITLMNNILGVPFAPEGDGMPPPPDRSIACPSHSPAGPPALRAYLGLVGNIEYSYIHVSGLCLLLCQVHHFANSESSL